MRIYHFSNARMPTEKAHGIQITQTASAFASLGHTVTVVVPKRPNTITEDTFTYYGIPKTFSVVTLPALSSQLSKQFGRLAYFLLQTSFAWSAYRYAQKHPADFYYHRDEFTFSLFTLLGLRSVFEMHNIPTHLFMHKPFLRRAKGIVVVSGGIKEALLTAGMTDTKILVAPAGVDLSAFENLPSEEEARNSLSLPQDKIIVMYTGQLFAWKGVDTLIEAAKDLPASICIVLVGGGGREEELKKKAEGSTAEVRFVGQVKHDLIPHYLAGSDIVVIPNSGKGDESRSYTSPLKLAEALASGKPIIASDLPSLHEVLDEGCACFVPPDDAKALAQTMSQLASDKEKRGSLGRHAKELSRTRDWKSRAQKILSIFAV